MASTSLYSPLCHQRDIRLLRIIPMGSVESLEVEMGSYSLDSDVQFTALSYVWGSPLQQHSIVCNGHIVSITRNLWEILSTLREQRQHGLLWADAICINQKDNAEKSSQVNMMRDIYKGAKDVIFWLGLEGVFDKAAVHLMNVFVQNHGYESDLESLRGSTLKELRLPYPDIGWYGWASLLFRPWFGRVWTVQEHLNATHSVFMSGTLKISTDLLVRCAYATGVCIRIKEAVTVTTHDFRGNMMLLYRPLSLAMDQRGRAMSGIEDVRIFDLWTRSKLLGATDPRDRVFALLSTQIAVSMDIINYKRDVDAVYTEIAKIALATPVAQTTGHDTSPCSLGPNPWGTGPQLTSRFLACRVSTPTSSSLPSWVPDWRPGEFVFIPLTRYFPGIVYFTGDYKHAAIVDGKTLYISGIIVDKPRFIIESMPYMESDRPYAIPKNSRLDDKAESWCKRILKWQFMCYLLAKNFGTMPRKGEVIENFCRTMAFNALSNESVSPAAHYIASFQALRKRFIGGNRGSDEWPISLPPYHAPAHQHVVYESRFWELSAGRKFCMSEKGSPAWVPQDTKLGDCICFLAGCAVPFVVRPIDESFELVGDCYLHRMMREASATCFIRPQLFKFQ